MAVKDYHCSVMAEVSPEEAFKKIACVPGWWAEDFKGSAKGAGDRFTVRFGDTFVDFEVSEAIPAERYVWKVKDCCLPWLKDSTEWTGASIVWEIAEIDGCARVDMTHQGLLPEIECFGVCQKGWDFYVGRSLLQFLKTGKGLPNQDPD